MKKLVVFDLDGTLAKSKSPIDATMAGLLYGLLGVAKVAVISGGDWPQFETQLLANLPSDPRLTGLCLLPTCGTKFFQYSDAWNELYSEELTVAEKTKITAALTAAMTETNLDAPTTWGDIVEDRGSQITLSALGQHAPLAEKAKWDPDQTKRKELLAHLAPLLPEFSVRMGGTTSIDVTRSGIDKAYGIAKLRDLLGISLDEMIFVGDSLFVGGNDYPAREIGVVSIAVAGPQETGPVIEAITACLDPSGALRL